MNRLCVECGTNFVINPARQSRCNPCLWQAYGAKQKEKRKTLEGRQKIRQWNRTRPRTERQKRTEIKHARKYVEKYPEKAKAKRKLNWEITMGRMVRPELCSICGKSDRRRDGRSLIQAHHDDYSKPLDVKWFCVQCHSDYHRKLKDEQ